MLVTELKESLKYSTGFTFFMLFVTYRTHTELRTTDRLNSTQ